MLPPGGPIKISLNLKLRLPPSHFGHLMTQQAKKGVTLLVGVTDPDSKGKLDYHSIMQVRKRTSGIQEIP